MLLNCYQWSTFAAPQAAICQPANLKPQIKSNFTVDSLTGYSSGESFHLVLYGPGSVTVEPSEEQPVMESP